MIYFEKLLPWLELAISCSDHYLKEFSSITLLIRSLSDFYSPAQIII